MYGLIFLLLANLSQAATIKIAVIDSGLDLHDSRFTSHLCPGGHKDFTGEGLQDDIGHGTHITGLIQKYAGESDYCMLIVKVYGKMGSVSNYFPALSYLQKLNIGVVNISGGGEKPFISEYYTFKAMFKTIFFVAAGNDNRNIDIEKNCYFPACYDLPNILPVGNMEYIGRKASSSNYGDRVKIWELGENQRSTVPFGYANMSGTSMATAIVTGKFIRELNAKINSK